tara:strand:+ start:368 stop:790 length:423 start_codon:yes stop_codon:yes gene_type:complete
MNKLIKYIILTINIFSFSVLAIENSKLITLQDVKNIFETNIQKWNQNVIFFEKKKSMERIIINDSDTYSLKSNFKKGYIIITPKFNSSQVDKLLLIFNIPNLDAHSLKKIKKHFDEMRPNFCNSITVKNDFFVNIELSKC